MSDIVVDGLTYPIVIADSAAERVAEFLPSGATMAIVSDQRVVARARRIARASERAGVNVLGQLSIRGGERCKTGETLARVWRWLVSRGADRQTVLVAVGGGTVSDLVGFAAATFMRGVRWLPVATTPLAMADAAIGGKTAIDLPEGKNLAGAFWDPIAVVADLGALSSLPRRQVMTGLAEIVKAAIIGDPALLELARSLRRTRVKSAQWRDAIASAARVKARIVAVDPRDAGGREALNLGHTLAHSLEHASRGRLQHGEAVSIGLRGEGLLAVQMGLFSAADHARVLAALKACGLPLAYGRLDPRAIEQAVSSDKKRRDGVVRFALPERIGAVRTGVAVSPDVLRRVVAQCARPPGAEELPK